MAGGRERELLLGKQVPVAENYAPELLYPIPRAEGRRAIGLTDTVPFFGCDVWHAYEISWLGSEGRPEARVGRFTFPAESPCMVESKSLKLYLNSLNEIVFDNEARFKETVEGDLSDITGCAVALELYRVNEPALAGAELGGECLDAVTPLGSTDNPTAAFLRCDQQDFVAEALFTHLMRSLCPVTGQPDWATVRIVYSGARLDRAGLLTYLLGYRRHQAFHEQCIEQIFSDIVAACGPTKLDVQGFYTRRGGLDINPFRSTDPAAKPLPRLNRQ